MKKINLRPFTEFLKSGSAASVIMFGCVVFALVIANSPFAFDFENLLSLRFGLSGGLIHLEFTVRNWINDGLMAVFFLLVGLEIKRELVEGELSSFKKASLPVISAMGGAALPSLIYFLFNKGLPSAPGWGIPMATDIAFALAIVTFLDKRVPPSLKIFLSALAIADDLFAIIVIAFFYSSGLHAEYLLYAAAVVGVLIFFNYSGVTSIWLYVIPGVFIWYFIHQSGVHATIAGILTAFTLPTTFDDKESPLEKLEHLLFKPVNFLILPLFALVNTNMSVADFTIGEFVSPMAFGIIAGLVIGKPVGISIAAWFAVRSGISAVPDGIQWSHLIGAGILGGIGFTMSIFIALLSFPGTEEIALAKLFVLFASVAAALVGSLWLIFIPKRGVIVNG